MSASFYDLMKYAKTGIASPDMTDFDKRRTLAAFGGYPVKTITGVPPISFKAQGDPLTDILIGGNMVQSGVPSPSSPIYPSETGDLVESGEHAGEYSIPITCNNTTKNIYLQEPIRKIGDYVDAAGMSIGGANRRIKKLVLTGDEDGWSATAFRIFIEANGAGLYGENTVTWMSNLYKAVLPDASESYTTCVTITPTADLNSSGNIKAFRFKDPSCANITEFKSFLAQQYANGTPVCIWYVLATEEHETATIPTITTAKGSNTLSIGTSLQPSSVSITGHIKQ